VTAVSATFGGRRFHLIERLGTGGHSDVFLAEQESPGGFRRRVALKVVRPSLEGRALREAARRMRDEARILGLLDHPNVVRVVDLVRLSDGWGVVMEPVPGIDLHRLLEVGQRVAPRPAFAIAAEVARALDAAWNARDGDDAPLQVIHRDIKPANVLLTVDGQVKVLDFGIASMNLQDPEGTAGLLVGTIGYMAPERVRREVDTPACDVYALGATLVELLLGEPMPPTPVDADQHGALVSGVLDRVRTCLQRSPPLVSAQAIALLRCTLHVDPARRPTAPQLVEQCEALSLRLDGEALGPFAAAWVPRSQLDGRGDGSLGVLVEAGTTGATGGSPRATAQWLLPAFAAGIAGMTVVSGAALLAAGLLVWVRMVAAPDPPRADAQADPLSLRERVGVRAPPRQVDQPRNHTPPPLASPREGPDPAVPVVASREAPAPALPAPPLEEPTPTAPDLASEPAEPSGEPLDVDDDNALDDHVLDDDDGLAEADAPAPRPAPVDAPPPAPMPALVGTWTGTASGSPMTLRVVAVDGRAVTARAEITQGTTMRSISLSGTCSESGLVLEGAAGERFEAALEAGVLAGTWAVRAGARPQRWRVDQR
jgi:eukaryotic-like serine/threonine-protein kinase